MPFQIFSLGIHAESISPQSSFNSAASKPRSLFAEDPYEGSARGPPVPGHSLETEGGPEIVSPYSYSTGLIFFYEINIDDFMQVIINTAMACAEPVQTVSKDAVKAMVSEPLA